MAFLRYVLTKEEPIMIENNQPINDENDREMSEEEEVNTEEPASEESRNIGSEPASTPKSESEPGLDQTRKLQLPTLGEQLKTLRLARRLTIADVANSMRLKSSIIDDIEMNVYEGHWDTFSKGYVKNYAKLVGMPEQVVENLLGLKKSCGACTSCHVNARMHETSTKDKRFRLITYLIIIIFIALIAIWRYRHHVNDDISPVVTPGAAEQVSSDTNQPNITSGDVDQESNTQQPATDSANVQTQQQDTNATTSLTTPSPDTKITLPWKNPDVKTTT